VKGSHIIDPRTKQPARGRFRTWAGAPTAALSDALSTAFMIMTEAEIRDYCRRHRHVSAYWLASDSALLSAAGFNDAASRVSFSAGS
jgi:thiamine biosynthesis lipoprotein ApbE